MSVLNRVWQMPAAAVTPTERLVLLVLASHAAHDGRDAYPGVQRIARHTSLTARGVQKALRRLAEKRFIHAIGTSSRRTTHYALALDRLPIDREHGSRPLRTTFATNANTVRDDRERDAGAGANAVHPGGEPRSPEGRTAFAATPNTVHPIRHRSVPDPSVIRTSAARSSGLLGEVVATVERETEGLLRAGFDAFWDAYPRRAGKAAAWKWWQKRKPDVALLATMIAALEWQRRQDNWLRDGGRFVPHPATWLNAERWLDEPSRTPHLNDRTIALMQAGEEFLK